MFLTKHYVLSTYQVNLATHNFEKKRLPVCPKSILCIENSPRIPRKCGKCARASPTRHHTLNEGQTARFIAHPSSELLVTKKSSDTKIFLYGMQGSPNLCTQTRLLTLPHDKSHLTAEQTQIYLTISCQKYVDLFVYELSLNINAPAAL